MLLKKEKKILHETDIFSFQIFLSYQTPYAPVRKQQKWVGKEANGWIETSGEKSDRSRSFSPGFPRPDFRLANGACSQLTRDAQRKGMEKRRRGGRLSRSTLTRDVERSKYKAAGGIIRFRCTAIEPIYFLFRFCTTRALAAKARRRLFN